MKAILDSNKTPINSVSSYKGRIALKFREYFKTYQQSVSKRDIDSKE
jgi:hypothetical protein